MKSKLKIAQWVFIVLISCAPEPKKKEAVVTQNQPMYSFAVAGHVYGNPSAYTGSIYPPFLVKLDSLMRVSPLNQLILTGDVVKDSAAKNWINVQQELDARGLEAWCIAPGNHDTGTYLDRHIQADKYMAFTHQNYLFLVLNTSNSGWTVDSVQRNFIKNSLNAHPKASGVFVFSHQLWWQKNAPAKFELDSVRPNSFALFEGQSDFWTDAFPFFETTEKEIYFFAGDMGSDALLEAYYEDHYTHFHFYGSGMGGGLADNFLYVQLFQDGAVKIERIDF